MLKRENGMHPCAATHALNTEAFAAQLLGGLEIGAADNRMRQLARDRRKDSQIKTLGGRPQNRSTAGVADFDIVRDKARNQSRCDYKENVTRIDSWICNQSMML